MCLPLAWEPRLAPSLLAGCLADDPFDVDPEHLHEIEVVGTVYEGEWFPAVTPGSTAWASAAPDRDDLPGLAGAMAGRDEPGGCSCRAARALSAAYLRLRRAA